MTQEEKQLLLKDLCARLPYSVFGLHRGEDLPLCAIDDSGAYMVLGYDAWFDLNTVPFKPYLRSMSSMTEEEYLKYSETRDWRYVDDDHYEYFDTLETFDWLNVHHFDFRNLIEKGLAIEAPKNIYKW